MSESTNETKKTPITASPEVVKMTREEAISYLGLPEGANSYAIDEKFWQLCKRYKSGSEEDEQKLVDLSEAYDIATGRRDARKKAIEIRENQRKYFGKTSDEWRNHWNYNWYKYLIAVVLIVIAGNLFYNIVLKPDYDCAIISLGHFDIENDTYYDNLLSDMGFNNPYITNVNIVVPNDEGELSSAYENQNAVTSLLIRPNIVVTEAKSAPYYYDQLMDLSDIYAELSSYLTPAQMAKIVPVYCSEREYYEYSNAYAESMDMLTEEEMDLSGYSTAREMIGLMITDEALITRMGYTYLWNDEPNMVFGIYYDPMDIADARNILIRLLSEL